MLYVLKKNVKRSALHFSYVVNFGGLPQFQNLQKQAMFENFQP